MLSTRRQILRGVTLAAPAFALPGFFAEALAADSGHRRRSVLSRPSAARHGQ